MQRVSAYLIGAAAAAAGLLLTGCGGRSTLPRGADAYAIIPAPTAERTPMDYRIGALDTININVFQEPDLTLKDVQVDAGGNILFPLIGTVIAAGKTTSALSSEIASRLSERFLENPQVSVIVSSSVSQKVTVEGSVTESGVYEIKGPTTLLEALAMAKGPTRVAALGDIAVFRTIGGKRMAAVFNLAAIRKGQADDPEILGNDVVVVGLSNLKAAYRDVLTTAPLVAVFRPFG